VASLPIGALERFVLSNIDGRRSRTELADLTGIGEGDVDRILDKLAALGAVHLDEAAAKANGAHAPAAPPADETLDLDPALRARIDEIHAALDTLDHYALLGVARDADRKAVKSAYYALAATFHTDRHFGKKLGSFKAKMEQIFGKATTAHDTLANKDRRAQYDAYLEERDRTQAYERLMAMVEGGGDFAEELRAETGRRPVILLPGAATPVTAVSKAKAKSVPPPPIEPEPPPPMVTAPTSEQDRQRREALARRLGGRALQGRHTTGPRPAVEVVRPHSDPQTATEAVRRMYEERRDAAKQAQAKKFIEGAEQALAKEDLVTAANNYRLAVRYTDDAEVHRKFEETNRRARDFMATAYLKQAKYEEQQQRWREAALSYGKAIDGRPDDPELHHGAANALRREGRDLHAAARHGEMAVQKNPNDAAFRVTLGHVYLDAGLFLRSRKELERALELEPANARAKELLAQVKKLMS